MKTTQVMVHLNRKQKFKLLSSWCEKEILFETVFIYSIREKKSCILDNFCFQVNFFPPVTSSRWVLMNFCILYPELWYQMDYLIFSSSTAQCI